jgi:hypothetical protein
MQKQSERVFFNIKYNMSNKIVKKKENLFIKKTFKPNNKFTKHTSIFYKKSFKYQKLLRKKKSLLIKFGGYLSGLNLLSTALLRSHNAITNKFFKYSLSISVVSNNIFLNFSKISFLKKGVRIAKSIEVANTGLYKLKTTKKRLKFNIKLILFSFLKSLKQRSIKFKDGLILNIVAPVRIRKEITTLISKIFKRETILINYKAKKCFNGCRVPKKKRKKSRGLKILKL